METAISGKLSGSSDPLSKAPKTSISPNPAFFKELFQLEFSQGQEFCRVFEYLLGVFYFSLCAELYPVLPLKVKKRIYA
jgi:hypothetical protein